MRLISLSSNRPTFHPVKFNRTGISLIVGKQKVRQDKKRADTHTYNGVGKSLLLYLINYCLGAEAREDFERDLTGWEFSLLVEFESGQRRITRKTSESNMVFLGEEKLSLDDFREQLRALVFPNSGDTKFLTFRSLMSLFLRPGKTAYNEYDAIHHSEMPVQRLMRSAFLLGLDVQPVIQKYDLREEVKRITEASSGFAKDPILKEYFTGKKDVDLEIGDLQERLDALELALRDFQVAENYHDVERRAAELKAQLQQVRNMDVVLEAKIRQVDESLKTKPELSLDDVRSVYSEASVHFSDQLKAKLEAVEEFHRELLQVRQTRLKSEKEALEKQLSACRRSLEELNNELDSNLRFLNEHGALGEFLSLSSRANDVRTHLQKLRDYKALKKRYRDRKRELQVELAAADLKAARYLDDTQKFFGEAAERFRSITRAIYPDKQSGLTIENDEGDNQTRFRIEAKIISDASQGINEAKIFAYDATLISLRRNHTADFVCHDSRLFADIDPRQRAKIFEIAHDLSVKHGFQYIATVNQDQIEALRELMSPEDFDRIFTRSTVLELNDDSAADKLLGVDIDLDYN